MDLALNNLQRLIYHKTQQTKPAPITIDITINLMLYIFLLVLWQDLGISLSFHFL